MRQSALAASGFSENAQNLRGGDLQIDAVQCAHAGPIGRSVCNTQPANLEKTVACATQSNMTPTSRVSLNSSQGTIRQGQAKVSVPLGLESCGGLVNLSASLVPQGAIADMAIFQ